jgi:hypothetical protein
MANPPNHYQLYTSQGFLPEHFAFQSVSQRTIQSFFLSLDYAFLAEYPRLCLVPHPYGLRWV